LKHHWIFHLMVMAMAASVGCVSISLKRGETTRSQVARFKDPSAPFEKISIAQVDSAWKNPKSGTILSYFSECAHTDPTLESIRDELVRELGNGVIENEKQLLVQNRDALRILARGAVDGVKSTLDLLTFKKDGCIYILTLVGGNQIQPDDQKKFESFIANFEVP
jgi:hypothetical protein